MFELLKKKPWGNLAERLTTDIPLLLRCFFLGYTLILPTFVILSYAVKGFNGIWLTLLLNLFAAIGFYFIPRYLRSGNRFLSLDETHKKPLFSIIYHTALKLGSLFAVVVFSYTAILILMLLLENMTGISQSQEIPDLSNMTFLDITYNSITAGLTEEVWRIAAIISTLLLCKAILGKVWKKKAVQNISLLFSLLFTSFIFGWLHTFGYSDSSFSVPITLQLGLIGIVLAGISLVTRRLWLAVFFHFFFDFVSFTLNAKAMHILESETAYEAFVEEYMMWFVSVGYFFFFLVGMFFLSIYLLRYAKGAKKVHQNIAP